VKDVAAAVLAFLFTEDKKEHPMPAGARQSLFAKIKAVLYRNEVETNEQGSADTAGDKGPGEECRCPE
jgi:hypothetical protein